MARDTTHDDAIARIVKLLVEGRAPLIHFRCAKCTGLDDAALRWTLRFSRIVVEPRFTIRDRGEDLRFVADIALCDPNGIVIAVEVTHKGMIPHHKRWAYDRHLPAWFEIMADQVLFQDEWDVRHGRLLCYRCRKLRARSRGRQKPLPPVRVEGTVTDIVDPWIEPARFSYPWEGSGHRDEALLRRIAPCYPTVDDEGGADSFLLPDGGLLTSDPSV